MKKTIVCVFAHPDDEAFGPGGTIALLAKNNDVYILCATRGEMGQCDPNDKNKISQIRSNELTNSADILGVKKVYFLGFKDGELCNNTYHQLAKEIEKYLKKIRPNTLITFEPRGISGHIDHIIVSLVTTYVFYKLRFVKTLMFYCLDKKIRSRVGKYFIYFPPGYEKSDIDKTMDVSGVWDTKLKAMHTHTSQITDVKRILKQRAGLPKQEHFQILKK